MKMSLSEIRQAVIGYYENPMQYVYMDKGEIHGDSFIAPIKSLEEVLGGVEFLGSGCYSNVYAISETKALKIVKGTDEGYARFVRLCQANRDNKHLPKIYYAGKWGKKTVYVLERLQPFDDYRDNEEFREAVQRCGRNKYIAMDTDIGKVSKLLQDNRLLNDLHRGNVMLRGDVPVITDPCS